MEEETIWTKLVLKTLPQNRFFKKRIGKADNFTPRPLTMYRNNYVPLTTIRTGNFNTEWNAPTHETTRRRCASQGFPRKDNSWPQLTSNGVLISKSTCRLLDSWYVSSVRNIILRRGEGQRILPEYGRVRVNIHNYKPGDRIASDEIFLYKILDKTSLWRTGTRPRLLSWKAILTYATCFLLRHVSF